MPSRVDICSIEELERMHTGSLLNRLRKLQKCEESRELSDWVHQENESSAEHIEFKNSESWALAYRELKEVLANREHLPTALEREARRKEGRRS